MKNYKWKNNGKHRKSNKHICGNTAAVMTNALLELLWTTTFQLSHTVTRLSRLTLVWRMWTVGLSRPVSVQDAKHFACLRPAKSCKVDMIHTTLHQVTIDCSYTCQPYSKKIIWNRSGPCSVAQVAGCIGACAHLKRERRSMCNKILPTQQHAADGLTAE